MIFCRISSFFSFVGGRALRCDRGRRAFTQGFIPSLAAFRCSPAGHRQKKRDDPPFQAHQSAFVTWEKIILPASPSFMSPSSSRLSWTIESPPPLPLVAFSLYLRLRCILGNFALLSIAPRRSEICCPIISVLRPHVGAVLPVQSQQP
jgi:hypothetical protein